MSRTSAIFLAVLLALILNLPSSLTSTAQVPPGPELVSLEEAEILVYVLPEAQQVRRQGMDIGSELQTNNKLNQDDFYTFWVINTKRDCASCSVTIGYFSVNKHTADLWDTSNMQLVKSTEIEGIQKIIRKARRIDADTIREFGSRAPNG
ncbi:MAG TPA: hypothetical protein VMH00_05025 [Candidatus Limnocylindrales bacterium]|nr:hypothetical protein [Candidatus Limnocylindrales bacterium]